MVVRAIGAAEDAGAWGQRIEGNANYAGMIPKDGEVVSVGLYYAMP